MEREERRERIRDNTLELSDNDGVDYALGDVLYSGAETRVVGGVHSPTGAQVAVKLSHELGASPRTLEKLRHEHALLREIETPGVIRALALEPLAGGLALVMERWGAMSLDRVLARGPLPVSTVLRLGAALARVLAQVHRRGVIHRDIKPQNVLVDAELSDVRLIDFGIATRKPTHVEETTAVETIAGTLAYMAPEQTGRMRRVVDARADLYALGVTLYELLTGALPFETSDVMQLIHAHIARTPTPPHERAPEQHIPAAVSAIVQRLLEKSPERRYQTADGVAFDLERAARSFAEAGTVEPFALGSHDWDDRIRAPSRLFGRERELATLAEALDRAARGEVVLALVGGPSGVGKSALVHAMRDRMRARRALFAPGKFDLLRRGTAYDALAQALRHVVRRRLADSAEEVARWKATWREAAGPNARILIDLVPELRHFFDEPPPLLELGPLEAKTRFQLTVQRFVRATATADHPLALFVDDLQWADPPSLDLLKEIVADADAAHLLLLGAYRDSEVDASHPLHALAAAAGDRGRHVVSVALEPLGDQALEDMVADVLDQPADDVRELSLRVKAKTDGSPFFVEQFLRALRERKLLARDLETGRWRWDADAIDRAGVTDNVVALLAAKIDALPEGARRVLSLAACVGPSFERAHVRAAGGLDATFVRDALDELLAEGLVVTATEDEHETYTFMHDRVQQAAYEALGEDERARAHASLAREIEGRKAWMARDDELYAMVYHYQRSLSLVGATGGAEGADEKRRVAELFLRGGQRAKAAAAYEQAAASLGAGRALLGGAGWDDAFELTFELQVALAEAEWLAGRGEVGEPLFKECDARARDVQQRARAAIAWLPFLFQADRFEEGLAMALEILEKMGWSFPRESAGHEAMLGELIGRIAPKILGTSAEAWRALPRCMDPRESSAVALLSVARLLAGGCQPVLQACLIFTLVEHAFSHGISPESGSAVGMAAIAFVGAFQQIELGAKCIDLVFALRDVPDLPKAAGLYQAMLPATHLRPIDAMLALGRELPEMCEREGDVMYLDFVRAALLSMRLYRGVPLAECAMPAQSWRTSMAQELVAVLQAGIDALRSTAQEEPASVLARMGELPATSPTVRVSLLTTPASVALHFGEDAEALRLAALAAPLWIQAYCSPAHLQLMLALTVLGPARAGDVGDDADALRKQVAFQRARLDKYAEINPPSFEHVRRLADAGIARAEGRYDDAERLYDEAIAGARRSRFVHHEALGLRLCGEHYLSRGKAFVARAYLHEAHDAYLRWGAHAAAARVRARHPDLFPTPERPAGGLDPARTLRTVTVEATTLTTQEGAFNARLDATSMMRAAQALSGDVVLSSLLGRMLRVLAENAGAERAVLALSRDGSLRVRAELSVEPEQLAADLDEPVDSSPRVPATLLQYVARSREPVVLGQADVDSRFDEDPYMREHRPASVLAVPLVHQGRLSGVVYLEHPRAAHAFPDVRVETAALLASQAATAVENATLYAELSASNERLERQVAERTAELRAAKEAADAANQAKSDFLTSMSHELRTPLNSILGYAQVLSRSASLSALLPDRDRDGLSIIRRSGEHLLTLINDVLDLAKIEAGKLELSPRDVRLSVLLRTVAGMSQVRADEKQLAFAYELTGAPLDTVRVDEKRLTQVLLNLVGNAIKFTERGRVHLRVEAQARRPAPPGGEAPPRVVCFRIEDTGPGIAPEHLARIFEPFEQAGDSISRAEGTGLGLAITRRIVERMGGTLHVESEVGRGSTFVVTLPLVEAGSGRAAAGTAWEQISGYRGERRTLLVVDDEAENRGVLRGLLEPLGFEIVQAERGEQVVELALAHRPAVIFMDVVMPDIDGYEATRRLRQLPDLADTVVIASSASAGEQARAHSASAGCNDFLAKPVRAEDLIDQLQRHLGLKWVLRDAPAPASEGAVPPEALPRPPAETIAELAALADGGRIRMLLDEVQRREQAAPELAPWFGHVRTLARRLEVKALREFLRAPSAPPPHGG